MKSANLWQITGLVIVLGLTHVIAYRAGGAAAQVESAPILKEIDRKQEEFAAVLHSTLRNNTATYEPMHAQDEKERQNCIALAGQVASLSLELQAERHDDTSDDAGAADMPGTGENADVPPRDEPKMCVARCPLPATADTTG